MIFKSTLTTLERIKVDLVNEFKSQIASKDLKATGRLENSIKGFITKSPKYLRLDITSKDYFAYIDEDGRSPGKRQPLEKIMKWVQDKGLGKSSNIKSKRVNRLRDVAWSIAKAIGDKGTIERFNYSGAKITSFVDQKYRNRITQDIKESYLLDLMGEIKPN